MTNIAIASRVFQFAAGPAKFCFHACAEHAEQLNQAPPNFLEIPGAPIRDEDPLDEIDCDLCTDGPR